jgi:transposase
MCKISEILRQRHDLKRSYREIGQSLGISIGTISDHLTRAKAAGLSWPLPEGLNEQALHDQLFLPAIQIGAVRPLPDWEMVHREQRKKGMTLLLLWREYRDIHADGLGYSQFCEHYRRYAKTLSPVMRQAHKAGEKTFVDYSGMKVPWIDARTGEIFEAEIFVGSLGASSFTFAEATASQQMQDWIASHSRMWEYFGGVSEIVVPDNLKSGVTKAHRYDPDINVNYQHVSEHYGFAIVPARVYKPKDKAKVESAVGCVERQILAPLRHMTFTSISEINAAIKPRLAAFNNQSFQKMKVSRRELFETLDKPVLKALPIDRYQYADWCHVKVNIDYHIAFKDHYYSVPCQYIAKGIQLRATSTTLECFYQGQRIAAHTRSFVRYGFTTLAEHMPPAHLAHAEWTPERLARWANKIGPKTQGFMENMISSRPFPQQAFRACLGLLRMSKQFSEERLEKACEIALTAGATRYQHVESILKNRLDSVPRSQEQPTLVIADHENIRGSDYYK